MEMEGIIVEQYHSVPSTLLRCNLKITQWSTINHYLKSFLSWQLLQVCWKQEWETTWLSKGFVSPSLALLIISQHWPQNFELSLLTSCIIIIIITFRMYEKMCLSIVQWEKKVTLKGKVGTREVSPKFCLDQRWVLRQISFRKVSKWT